MNRNLFKSLLFVAVIAALISVLAVTAFADDRTVTASGECGANGDNLTWKLYDDGELVIYGNGAMNHYTYGALAPWYNYRTQIKKLNIESGVTSIGDSAFYRCQSLTSIKIPEGVTSIGPYAFLNCSALTAIEVNANNTAYADVDGVLFTKDMKTIVAYPAGKTATNYTIPASVTSIGNSAFEYCQSLTSIEIPEGVTSIGDYAFFACQSLTSIEIPEGVTSIGDYAFFACQSLTSIEIPEGVTSIGIFAFYRCQSLTSIEIPASVTSIGNYAFSNCSNLASVTIYSENASFGSGVFKSCADDFTIKGYSGSTAEAYAAANNHTFVPFTRGEIKLNTASLSLYNDLAVNFKANKESLDASGYYNVYAVFEFCGKTYKVTDYTIDKITVSGQKVDAYVFAFKNLSPDRMTDTIKATLYGTFNGTEYASATVEYSIAKYCYNQLNKITSKNALATVCVDLLNYGTESQKVTSHNLDNLANANLTEEQKSWGTQDVREFVSSTKKDQTPAVELAIWKTAALKLREDITAEMKFAADDITGLYVEVDILDCECQKSSHK